MLTRENVGEVVADAMGLVDISKSAAYARMKSRSLRRFLSRLIEVKDDGAQFLVMAWSHYEGHSPEQIAALDNYVRPLSTWLETHPQVAPLLKRHGITRNDAESIYCVTFEVTPALELASLVELQRLVNALRVVAVSMSDFARNANATVFADCPEYRYRGLPCSIAPDEKLWYVGGQDKQGGSGVLEWCYDKSDAQHMLTAMQHHSARFVGLTAAKFLPN
jgi:hypothetical protein